MPRFVFVSCLVIFHFYSFAQTPNEHSALKNRFGFNLGTNYSFVQTSSIQNVVSPFQGVGFSLGLIMDHKIKETLFFSPKAELSFNEAGLTMKGESFSPQSYRLYPVLMELMPHMTYKPGTGKFSPYLSIGPGLRLPIRSKEMGITTLRTGYDISIDVAVGFLNEFKAFVFAPELRYSYGTMNLHTDPLSQNVRFSKISLLVNFK